MPRPPQPNTDQIARTAALIGAGLPLPRDLGNWVIAALAKAEPPADRRAQRDAHLVSAACLLSGNPHRKAQTLIRIAERLQRRSDWRTQQHSSGSIEAHLHAALLCGPLPRDRRLRDILTSLVNAA